MRILVTNDDGIFSPGLLALAGIASELGEVRIVAPDVEQSSMGQAITASRPLYYRRAAIKGFEAYRVNGTPADCVALGAHQWTGVDLVLSGINLGLNIGGEMWHSGTLAAARQASLLGLRGIAVSAPAPEGEPSYDHLAVFGRRVLRALAAAKELSLVNVNFPLKPEGVAWTRQSVRHYGGRVTPGEDPHGHPHFWFVAVPVEATEEGTDRWAVEHGLVSVTPLKLDLTDHEALSRARSSGLLR